MGDKFSTLVADPPWPYKNPGEFTSGNTPIARGAGSETRYGAMSLPELAGLDIAPLIDDNAHLYLWTTNAFVPHAWELADAWGFRPITMCTWVKTTTEPIKAVCPTCLELGCPAHNEATCKECGWPPKIGLPTGHARVSGRAGYYFRGATEHCLFGVKGSLKLQTKEALPSAWLWPRLPHSVKPDAFYDLVELASPGPYLELFARRNRLDWETWGDQSLEHVVMGEDNVVELPQPS